MSGTSRTGPINRDPRVHQTGQLRPDPVGTYTAAVPDALPRPLRRPALVGGFLALVVTTWMVAGGSGSLFGPPLLLGGIFDAQGRALTEGHLDVVPEEVYFEGIVVGGRTHVYYGILPSMARLPILVATDRFDDRLTGPSLVLGTAVLLTAGTHLLALARARMRGDAPITRVERAVTGAWLFLLAAGTPVVFLASRRWIYHEAELWGAALSLAGFGQLLAWTMRPTRWRLVAFGAVTTMAILTRASVGVGPAMAMGILWLDLNQARLRGRAPRWAPEELAGLSAWERVGTAATVGTPVALHALVNWARFGSLFGVPFDQQVLSQFDKPRQAALVDNGGSLFGLQFIPSSLVRFLDPTAIEFRRTFPFVDFPGPPTILGDVTYDTIDLTSSLTASAPLLSLLAVVGLFALFVRRHKVALAPWRVCVAAAAATVLPTLGIAFIAHRYLSDLLPVAVLAATLGLQVVLPRAHDEPAPEPRRRAGRRIMAAALLTLGAASVWFSIGLAVRYQATGTLASGAEGRARAVALQQKASRLPLVVGLPVERGATLPSTAADGTLHVIGDCTALYQWSFDQWLPLARAGRAGRYIFSVEGVGGRSGGGVVPLARAEGRDGAYSVTVATGADDTWRLQIRRDDGIVIEIPLRSTPSQVTVTFDHHLDRVEAESGGLVVHQPAPLLGFDMELGASSGTSAVPERSPVTVRARPATTAECRRILGPDD